MMRRVAPIFLCMLLGCSSSESPSNGAAGSGTVNLDGGGGTGGAAGEGGAAGDGGAAATGGFAQFDGPELLSETGLFADFATRTLAADVVEYDVAFELWSDGAAKQRYLYLPPGEPLDTSDMDNWVAPVGTKAWKEFRVDGKLVETRLLEKRTGGDDGWLMVSYLWREDGSDADAVPLGQPDAADTNHDVPNQEQCVQCHGGVADTLIGVSALQLGAESSGNLLAQLSSRGQLSDVPLQSPVVPGTGNVRDALAYLHANCGHCHNDTSFLANKRSLRLRLRVSDDVAEQSPAYATAIDAPMNHNIMGTTVGVVPGDPSASQLYLRMQLRDLNAMPPVGSEIADPDGTSAIEQWILDLPSQ